MAEEICWRAVGALAGGRAIAECCFCAVGRELLSGPSVGLISVPELFQGETGLETDRDILHAAARRGVAGSTHSEQFKTFETLARYDCDKLHFA